MNIDRVVKACKDAFMGARELDEEWTGKLRKPPEYLIAVAIAREISGIYQDTTRITLEANAKQAIEEALLEPLSKEQSAEFGQKRVDILLERVYANTTYPWAIIEVKNGEYGFKGNVLEKDLVRLCRILSFDHWSIHYGILVTYYVIAKRSSAVAQDSIRGKMEKRRNDIKRLVAHDYPDLSCKNYPNKLGFNSHSESASNYAWGVDVVRIGKWT